MFDALGNLSSGLRVLLETSYPFILVLRILSKPFIYRRSYQRDSTPLLCGNTKGYRCSWKEQHDSYMNGLPGFSLSILLRMMVKTNVFFLHPWVKSVPDFFCCIKPNAPVFWSWNGWVAILRDIVSPCS